MIDADGDVAIAEEGNDIVEVFEGGAAGGDDHGFFSFCDFFDEDPVVHVGAGDFDDGNAEVGAKIDGSLVEGCGGGEEAGLADRLYEGCIVVVAQPGVECLFDVAKILAINEVFMDEGVHVAELQLDGRPDIIKSNHLGERIDDFEAAFEAAEVIIGHFQHKQVFENVTIDHSASSIGKRAKKRENWVHESLVELLGQAHDIHAA